MQKVTILFFVVLTLCCLSTFVNPLMGQNDPGAQLESHDDPKLEDPDDCLSCEEAIEAAVKKYQTIADEKCQSFFAETICCINGAAVAVLMYFEPSRHIECGN